MKKTTLFAALGFALAATILLTAFSKKIEPISNAEATFEEFLKEFPAQQLPYALDETSLKATLDGYVKQVDDRDGRPSNRQSRRLDWEFYHFLPDLQNEASFSRLPIQVEPIALFATADHYAVMYSTSRSYRFGFATYTLAVLDKSGKQISSNVVGQTMPETIISANISADLKAEVKTWRVEWKKNYSENGLDGNKIKNLSWIETAAIDLLQPTEAKIEHGLRRHLLAPPVIEVEPSPTEGVKSE